MKRSKVTFVLAIVGAFVAGSIVVSPGLRAYAPSTSHDDILSALERAIKGTLSNSAQVRSITALDFSDSEETVFGFGCDQPYVLHSVLVNFGNTGGDDFQPALVNMFVGQTYGLKDPSSGSVLQELIQVNQGIDPATMGGGYVKVTKASSDGKNENHGISLILTTAGNAKCDISVSTP